jgi:hypothetical protein
MDSRREAGTEPGKKEAGERVRPEPAAAPGTPCVLCSWQLVVATRPRQLALKSGSRTPHQLAGSAANGEETHDRRQQQQQFAAAHRACAIFHNKHTKRRYLLILLVIYGIMPCPLCPCPCPRAAVLGASVISNKTYCQYITYM